MDKPDIWKILLGAGAFLLFVAFILGWIGFGVPDWQSTQRYFNSPEEHYGLWAYCQNSVSNSTTVCRRWPDAATQLFNGSRPSFVSAADGLVTTGMILLTFGLIAAFFAAILPLLAYGAAGLAFLAFLMIVIGVPIFGVQANNMSKARGDVLYGKLYGIKLMIATIVFTFVSSILLALAGFFYQKFGFGNIATHTYRRRPNGGQQLLGPAQYLTNMVYATRPGAYGVGGMMMNPYQNQGLAGFQQPSLLSQYIAQRIPRYYGPRIIQPTIVSAIPQPSITRALGQPVYVTPAYYRAPAVARPAYVAPSIVRPTYVPTINLSGATLVGPVVNSS